ncbi:MAG: thiazole synthase [Chloroflexi bacterium]|nr:thiazole synthase [Chloroflexota bacterium]MCH7655119.1 thiazole synthase [Chloroflexota bacterium]
MLHIGEFTFRSRLIAGTGRHRSNEQLVASLDASGAEVVTVAIRRLDLDHPNEPTILDVIDPDRYTVLPNTAGCKTVEEAVMVARLARSLGLPNWVKLEVIPDPKYLLPDPIGTLEAAKALLADGFTVLPYIHADPVLARHLQEVGCATVMPLGSAIGSGRGIHTREEITIIIEQATVPVVVDAGLGVPSDASQAMEMGADAVLVNTAIARAKDPALMGEAFKLGVEAGRKAYLAGRIEQQAYAQASSPLEGVIQATS